MPNLTQDILYGNNYSEPLLPENPIRCAVGGVQFTRFMLMMIPFWVLSIWLTLYGVNVILCKLFNMVYNLRSPQQPIRFYSAIVALHSLIGY